MVLRLLPVGGRSKPKPKPKPQTEPQGGEADRSGVPPKDY